MLKGADDTTPLSRSPNDSGTRRQKALLIGVRNVGQGSENYPELQHAHEDVHEMRALLIDIYHYTPADITVLLDDEIGGHIQPTRENIFGAVRDLVKDVKAGDRLFFHYSGHATQVSNSRSNSEEDGMVECEEDGMIECIPPLDSEETMIVDNELHAHLVESLPAGAHLVAIFDACHSGSLLNLKHYLCNRVFVPWFFRGRHNSEDPRLPRRNEVLPRVSPRDQVLLLANPLNEDIRQRKGPGEPLSPLPSVRRRTVFPRLSAFSKLRPRTRLRPLDTSATTLAWILPEEDQRYASPVGRFVCNGWCRDHRPQDADADGVKADVISLASCQGSQITWEDKTSDGMRMTMTSALVNILRADPNRSLKSVLMSVSHAIYSMALERQRKEFENHSKRESCNSIASSTLLTLPESAPVPAHLVRAQTFPTLHRKGTAFAKQVMHHIERMPLLLKKARQRAGYEMEYDMDHFQNPELASPQPLDMNRPWRM